MQFNRTSSTSACSLYAPFFPFSRSPGRLEGSEASFVAGISISGEAIGVAIYIQPRLQFRSSGIGLRAGDGRCGLRCGRRQILRKSQRQTAQQDSTKAASRKSDPKGARLEEERREHRPLDARQLNDIGLDANWEQ